MKIRVIGCVLAMVALGASAATNDLSIAREALRDGLWEIARTHGRAANCDDGRLIVLETYAREENWKGLLAAYDAMGYPPGEGFSYYRAAALFRSGMLSAASNILSGTTITNAAFARPAVRLRAEMALTAHDPVRALAILKDAGGDEIETKLLMASCQAELGATDASKVLWHEVARDTNATERARSIAAAGLRDAALLRTFATSARSAIVRRYAAVRLGALLVEDDRTFAEGEKTIREIVQTEPDTEGARAAWLVLAERHLARREFTKADKIYLEALQIWPNLSTDSSVHAGRGWALLNQGQYDLAIDEFKNAETLATDAETKASAAVKRGDALALMGREGESTEVFLGVCRDYPNTSAAAKLARVIEFREKLSDAKELYRQFKFDEARKAFSALAADFPNRRDSLAFYSVLCAYGAGDDEAAERGARGLAANSADAQTRIDATLWLAKYLFNHGRWRESEDLFRRYVRLSPQSAESPQALVWASRAALSARDYHAAISNVTVLVSSYPASSARAAGLRTQGEALIELGRFDEAVLVLERAALVDGAMPEDRLSARILRADALFAMGADNPARYAAALEAYGSIRSGEALTPSAEITVAYKMARTLEKLKRLDEAMDMYYSRVVLAYRTGRLAGSHYDDAARVAFVRAAFHLADEYESRGHVRQAVHVLDLIRTSDVSAATEATGRMEKLTSKEGMP